MKPLYLILLSLLFTGCVKENIAPAISKTTTSVIKDDSLKSSVATIKVDTVKSNTSNTQTNISTAYDWYNGTKGTALIQVTCNDCTAIATIGNDTVPFLFNDKGVGQLKYTPAPGLPIYIAVCPGSVKTIKADIFDASNAVLYTYSALSSSNWNNTYIIK